MCFVYCWIMLLYAPNKHECLYETLLSIKKCDMSENRHIVYTVNRTTVKRKNRRRIECLTHKKKLKQN